MNILTIDTATELEFIVITTEDGGYSTAAPIDCSHSITLFDNIENSISTANIKIKDIDCISVGIGPGSFTGIRIAVSTARMLAQLLKVPLIGVKTHELYARSIESEEGSNILIAFDAKKGKVFGALYANTEKNNIIEITPPGDYKIEELIESISNKDKTICLGNGVDLYYQIISEKVKDIHIEKNLDPQPARIGSYIESIMKAKGEASDYQDVIPFYARKSDAEVAMEIRQNKKST